MLASISCLVWRVSLGGGVTLVKSKVGEAHQSGRSNHSTRVEPLDSSDTINIARLGWIDQTAIAMTYMSPLNQ